ncbi:DUF350 domain-containing protein [Paenibacillus protaetiae]|uniref:DUF350 domain-containing protein n=1 Tax=Paenibacillus protaetiae TaxID=2509456 RepID=A0A4P6EY52_9BACL|nr:DUF350 domain-containing protein [Paenibacillus protaetiae]QAY66699.1 DUF350 domain-containing protein [Paenibacillus protaetiae]
MDWIEIARIPVWAVFGSVLLLVLMLLDSLTTKYKDLQEIRDGNTAVTVRFVMKLAAQAYILGQSIHKSGDIGEALIISVVSFVILMLMEWLFRFGLSAASRIKLEDGIHEGKINYALFAGSIHLAGALIIGAV